MRAPVPLRLFRLHRDRRGVSAIEFALLLPMMATLYLGGFEVTEAVAINRKVTHAASVLGDLVTQAREVDDDDIDNVFDAVETVMAPYSSVAAQMIVTQVLVNEDGEAEVNWSDARNTDPYEAGDILDLPDGVLIEDYYLIVAEVTYEHQPTFAMILVGSIEMNERFILRARVEDMVERE